MSCLVVYCLGPVVSDEPPSDPFMMPVSLVRILAFTFVLGFYAYVPRAEVTPPPPSPSQPPLIWARLCDASEEAQTRPVWQGLDGWLFERGDLIETLRLEVPLAPFLSRLAAALKEAGSTPLALIVPPRGAVHHAHMGDNPAFAAYDPEAAAAGYREFLSELRAAGFLAPDLLAAAEGEPAFFFARDHHWAPAGARRSAQSVAREALEVLGGFEAQRFETRALGSERQIGTLQERAERRCGVRLPDEAVTRFETERLSDADALGAALFERVETPVVLAGTSNSLRGEDKPEVNFSGFLREALSQEVNNVSFQGAGIAGSLQAYVLSDSFRESPPALLLWESLFVIWHANSRLVAELRQLIPSVYGSCLAGVEEARLETLVPDQNGFVTLLDGLGPLHLRAQDVYVQLEFDDASLVDFALELRYSGKPSNSDSARGAAQPFQETLPFSRTTRVPNSGRFFLELSYGAGALEGVQLRLGEGPNAEVSGGARVRLCRLPV